MTDTSSLRQFMILLYKGLLLRKRHYIVTFFEVVIPVLIASILPIIQSEVNASEARYRSLYDQQSSQGPQQPLWQNYTTYPPFDPYKSEGVVIYDLHFVAMPENDLTKQFMNEAIDKFQKNGGYDRNITYKYVKTEKEMETYCLYLQRSDPDLIIIGTVFDNFESGNLPSSLNYKIRYKDNNGGSIFQTQLKYRINGPQYSEPYSRTFFLSWQMSVEETFIGRKMSETGQNINYKIWMQRFPYPEHRDSKSFITVYNLIPMVIGYGYLIFMINIVRRLIEEKTNGTKELLKMMGMTDCVYWTSTFLNFFIVGFFTILIIAIVYKAPLKLSYVFLAKTDFFLLLIFLLLFMASLILFCMAFSIFFTKGVFAVIATSALYNVASQMLMTKFFLIDVDTNYFPLPLIDKLSICLLPPGSLLTFFFFVSFYESTGEGAKWSNITEFSVSPDLNMLMVMVMMIVSCLIYIFIIWYFDKVWPWQQGIPMPFYFLFTKSYWCGTEAKAAEEVELVNQSDHNMEFFEDEPAGCTPGVVIHNLSKEFRMGFQNKLAVKNVSLNFYNGQITALLGHNGAGKTTTINILTGLYTPTSGSASINGLSILTDTVKARRGLGVCPQHNVLFDTLTPLEHLKIYAALKGVPWRQLNYEAKEILDMLKLSNKKNELVKNLSGGMKRKLSLGIAIVGGSKVLFLDEPTSGMDVEARRGVWDTLLELRHNRTVILTTHYMEEADILGDRIAIMAEGEIQCSGSPIFLKRKFGTGYHLHVVKMDNFDMDGTVKLLERYVPDVAVGNELAKDVTFNLSSNNNTLFGDMFESLEESKNKLGISSCGITITTMEDVFLNVSNISDLKYKLQKENEADKENFIEFEDVYGDSNFNTAPSPLNQFLGLMLKRFNYAKRHWSILIAQLALPLFMMCMLMYVISQSDSQYRTKYDPLNLDIYQIYGKTDGFFALKTKENPELQSKLTSVLSGNKVSVHDVDDPSVYILKYGKNDISMYLKNLMIGQAMDVYSDNTLNLTAWYNGEPYHASPLSLQALHNGILKYVTDKGSISLTNAPLPNMPTGSSNINDGMRIIERIMASVFVPLALGFLSASYVLLPTHERNTKAKLLQLMTGIPSAMYWLSMFLWDFLVHFVVSILLIIPFAIFCHYVFFSPHSNAIGTAILLMLLYGWASIPFSYLISFLFKKPNTGFSLIIGICSIMGVAASTTLTTLSMTFHDSGIIKAFIWIFRFFPTFSVATGFSQLFGLAFSNAVCESLSAEDLEFNCEAGLTPRHPLFKCCKNICGSECLNQTSLITWESDACGRDVFFLTLDGFIYFALLLFFETALMASLGRHLKQQWLKLRKRVAGNIIKDSVVDDSDVMKEEDRIKDSFSLGGNPQTDALVVMNMTKVFRNYFAVDHLTFGIHKEECFGLLGVNGAGKTTTFRMLTGDCYPDNGNAHIGSWSVIADLKKFQSFLGYCPQFDALIDRLTGHEMLDLFGRLRGLSGRELDERISKMIKMTDLDAHAHKQTQFYSGGNKRKLSVALALIGSPPLILLDEPTAGVDPVSRRKIWNILAQARNNTKAAILLTTHSMEESEALCSRLGIMVNGRFRCLGSIQQLKTKYGQGYTLIIKLKRETVGNLNYVNEIKVYIDTNLLGAELKDDHQGMLQYHVVDPSVTLSRLFKLMADMKSKFDLEDYLISDTSLEQIFLTFARAQRIL